MYLEGLGKRLSISTSIYFRRCCLMQIVWDQESNSFWSLPLEIDWWSYFFSKKIFVMTKEYFGIFNNILAFYRALIYVLVSTLEESPCNCICFAIMLKCFIFCDEDIMLSFHCIPDCSQRQWSNLKGLGILQTTGAKLRYPLIWVLLFPLFVIMFVSSCTEDYNICSKNLLIG